MTPFQVLSDPRDHALVLSVHGELDMATVPQLRAAIADARNRKAAHCVVDLTACTFIDSSGSRALANEAEAFESEGLQLSVHCPLEHRKIRFVIELVGLPEVMTVTPRDDAEL